MNDRAVSGKRFWALTGPALVAGVAYLDPGNVATNLTAGYTHGYLLLWVLILANLVAWLVQYLAAKLGLATGKSLSAAMGSRLRTKTGRFLYWAQAQVVAIATDLAEVIGGAIALNLLFHIPLFIGCVVTAAIATGLLYYQASGRAHMFEIIIIGLIAITAVGFALSMFYAKPDSAFDLPLATASATNPVTLALGIIGATIMPHAVYVHSALSSDRLSVTKGKGLIGVIRADVTIAMAIAGAVNVSLLVIGAKLGPNGFAQDFISATFETLSHSGIWLGAAFGLALFASSLASTSVGTLTGDVILGGVKLSKPLPIFVRQLITLVPALIVLASPISPTNLLVISQVFISFGIPFALFPLVRLTANKLLMGKFANTRFTSVLGYSIVSALSALNIWAIVSPLFA